MYGNHVQAAFAALAMLVGASGVAAASQITIAQNVDVVSLDPAFRADTTTGTVIGHIYDSIMFRNATMEPKPRLAESVVQKSPTEWVITLRPNLKFSNGEALDAEAVRFTIARLLKPELKSPTREWWKGFAKVEVLDQRTVKITTAKPDPLFEARMTLLNPVPPKYIAEVGDAEFARKPVSSGAYKLVEWRRDESLTLERNADYYGGAPSIEKVTFRVIPEDLARVAALQTGEVDVVSKVPPDQALGLENAEDFRLERTPSVRTLAIQFDVTKPPGDNQKFREAVAYAVDRALIVKGLFHGYASALNSSISPSIPGWPKDTNYLHAHDLDRAKHLVQEAGLGDQEIVLRAPSGRYLLDRETSMAVAGQLKQAGLNVKVRPEEWGVFFSDLQKHSMSPIYLMGQGNVWLDAYPQIEAFQRSNGFLSTWADPELDALLDKSNQVPKSERSGVLGQALQRLKDTTAVVPLLALQDIYGVRNRIQWKPRPDEQIFAFEMQATD